MPNAEARSWWDDVQHLRPGANEPAPRTPEPRRDAGADPGFGDDRPAGSPRARRRTAPAVEADTPRRLARSDAAGFASAFDLDGAFGIPGRRQTETSRTIVLERDGDDLAGAARERHGSDLAGAQPSAADRDLDEAAASGADRELDDTDFFGAGREHSYDRLSAMREDAGGDDAAARRRPAARADRAASRRSAGERRSHRASVHGEHRARRASFAEPVGSEREPAAVVAEDLLDPAPEAERGADGRRTVQITGRTVPAPRLRLHEIEQRRPQRRAVDRVGSRPDRIAMWAVMLGLFLVLLAATSGPAHAATPSRHRAAAPVAQHVAAPATHRLVTVAPRVRH